MAVRIQAGSAKIEITARPKVNPPAVLGRLMAYSASPIQATGEVMLLGEAGDSVAGWSLGFVQVQWIETNWALYRGETIRDGSIFVQRARPPARPNQACCDCVDGSPPELLFYSANPSDGESVIAPVDAPFPLKLTVSHYDEPSDLLNLVEANEGPASGKPKPNFLAESQMEFHFCTILSLREPSGVFHHLQFFYWNVHWQAQFRPASFNDPPDKFKIDVIPAGSSASVGPVYDGAPGDARFAGILTAPPSVSCNQMATTEINAPNRHVAPVWQNFDVRLP
ncbi:MAG TPA: hypothetical protein VHW24_05540 [Bryobacteraceae bacterium]|nr:hypothetical protein [Bryobacteraceae bacterium]